MPNSSNPFNLVAAAMIIFCGVLCLPLGVVGFFAETGEMRWVFGILGLAGVAMVGGGIQTIVAWRRATAWETAHESALRAAAHGPPGSAPAGAEPATLEEEARREALVLAHWRYEPGEWGAYTRREYTFRTREAFAVGLGIAALGTVFLMSTREASFGLALGISGLIGAVVGAGRSLIARSAHSTNAASTGGGEVVISPTAILLNGRYHVLEDDRFHFAGVEYLDDETPPVLEFTVKWSTRKGVTNEQTRVPVPRGREAEARALAASFPRPPSPARGEGSTTIADDAQAPA